MLFFITLGKVLFLVMTKLWKWVFQSFILFERQTLCMRKTTVIGSNSFEVCSTTKQVVFSTPRLWNWKVLKWIDPVCCLISENCVCLIIVELSCWWLYFLGARVRRWSRNCFMWGNSCKWHYLHQFKSGGSVYTVQYCVYYYYCGFWSNRTLPYFPLSSSVRPPFVTGVTY